VGSIEGLPLVDVEGISLGVKFALGVTDGPSLLTKVRAKLGLIGVSVGLLVGVVLGVFEGFSLGVALFVGSSDGVDDGL